jgi:hypothetical protein
MMVQGLLPLRLNCPWRASAASAMVRSAMLGPWASIGAVRLMAPYHATSTSIAVPMPVWTPTFEQSDSLYVALRIDTLIHLGFRA